MPTGNPSNAAPKSVPCKKRVLVTNYRRQMSRVSCYQPDICPQSTEKDKKKTKE